MNIKTIEKGYTQVITFDNEQFVTDAQRCLDLAIAQMDKEYGVACWGVDHYEFFEMMDGYGDLPEYADANRPGAHEDLTETHEYEMFWKATSLLFKSRGQ